MTEAKQTSKKLDFFIRNEIFPDAKAAFLFKQQSLDAIKETCLVGIDANVLLVPYQTDKTSLDIIISVYRRLHAENRLVIPAQSVREFLSHRAEKLGSVVQQLRDEASRLVPPLRKKFGILEEDASFKEAKAISTQLREQNKKLQSALNEMAEKLSLNVGDDPVSVAYRDFVNAVRELHLDEQIKEDLRKELERRYEHKIPPGYMDAKNPTGGAGDLLIWRSLLEEGKKEKKDLIFVTGEEKPDWWVRDHGPFQPRLELVEEYRAFTGGYTIHIIPLSKLLSLFEVEENMLRVVKNVEQANTAAAIVSTFPEFVQYTFKAAASPEQLIKLKDGFVSELADTELQIENLGLPWLPQDQTSQQLHALRDRVRNLRAKIELLDAELTRDKSFD